MRAVRASYSTASRASDKAAPLLELISRVGLESNAVEVKGKGRVNNDYDMGEVVVGTPDSEDVMKPEPDVVRKSRKRRCFGPMAGKSMQPVPSSSSSSAIIDKEEDVTVIDGGIFPERCFKPLKETRKWRRSHVPRLAHGLEAVLEKRGVHWLKDPETGQYKFDQYLESIPKVDDFAFDRLPGFIPSSQDATLIAAARQAKCKYVGSTSSLKGILSQIYLLLSQEKLVSLDSLSRAFKEAPRYFTPGQRIPASVILRYNDGIYTTDVDQERDDAGEDIILLALGTLLEKFLTLDKHEFAKFLKPHTENNHLHLKDVHRYARHGKFLMRSQLDCVSKDLPGSGVFDLKTRAISPIRHDVYNYQAYLEHTLDALTGRRGTFEEEYYDMIRAAFLEYSFQARIGNMSGIMVAYHNTARIFGFQYISLRELDKSLFGRNVNGTHVFLRCVRLMETLYSHITRCFPEQSVRCTFEKRSKYLRVWVEPLEHSDPDSESPIVELKLSLQNIISGKQVKGTEAIVADGSWGIQYRLERINGPREGILARRNRAYARQMSLGSSPSEPPSEAEADADLTLDAAVESVTLIDEILSDTTK